MFRNSIRTVLISAVLLLAWGSSADAVIAVPSYCIEPQRCMECLVRDSDQNCVQCRKRITSSCRLRPLRRSAPASLTPEQLAILQAHNAMRDKHCVRRLQWSGELAARAEAWARLCRKDAGGNFCHENVCGTRTTFGENLSAGFKTSNGVAILPGRTAKEAVDAWYCEIQAYDFNNPRIVGGSTSGCTPVNGHFTQLVWRDTRRIGCAPATCSVQGRQGTFWVCKYDPGGNINTREALTQNVTRVCQ